MELKCPSCGNVITKESDATDCHFCGESLISFWSNIEKVNTEKAANDTKNLILKSMQDCIDNLEKGFQELMAAKVSGAMKVYFEKIATENSPAQFAEYAEKEDYKILYNKLSNKYESFTNLLNQKIKSTKITKYGILGVIVAVVLIGGISVLSIMNRKQANIVVKGGDSNVAVNVNNNTGAATTTNTNVDSEQNNNGGTNVNVNNDITVNAGGPRSKYESYCFATADECINYFLNTRDWVERAKCCNYPDNAIVLLNAIKKKYGDDFLNCKVITKKEEEEWGYRYYVKNTGKVPINYKGEKEIYFNVGKENNGYRISLFGSLYKFGKDGDNWDGFYIKKSPSNVCYMVTYAQLSDREFNFADPKGLENKYNYKNSYKIVIFNSKTGEAYGDNIYVRKDSTIGKKVFDLLSDGYAHRIELGLVWDTDNYLIINHSSGSKEKESKESVEIIKDVIPIFDVGFVKNDDELTKLEQNYVPAPKM